MGGQGAYMISSQKIRYGDTKMHHTQPWASIYFSQNVARIKSNTINKLQNL